MSPLLVRCFAKINTVLLVVGRRDDGFHELDTEFVSLALCDELVVHAPASGFTLDVEGGEPAIGAPEDNLVLKAARALQAEVGARLPGARFLLRKRIPVAAGLGGGSSDAAGALAGLDRVFGLAVPAARLAEIALQLGSDVPYFLEGGRQRGRGRGERLQALPDRPDRTVVLLKPRQPLPTADVFRLHARLAAEDPKIGRDFALTSRKTGLSLDSTTWWSSHDVVVHDDLAAAALRLAPRIGDIAAAAERAFPEGIVGMTGSGPTVFVLLPGGAPDESRLAPLAPLADAWVTRTIGREEYHAARFG